MTQATAPQPGLREEVGTVKEEEDMATRDHALSTGAATPKSAAPDLRRLEQKLLGSGYRMVCRHPNIDGDPIDAPTRGCLIDSGQPEQCEMSQHDNPSRVTDKQHCEFWRRKAAKEPTRLSISEGLALIAALRGSGSTSVPAQVAGQVPGTNPLPLPPTQQGGGA